MPKTKRTSKPKNSQRRRRQRTPALRLRASPTHGLGVFAVTKIPNGKRIVEYTGERITDHRGDMRALADPKRRADDFMFCLNSRIILDALTEGSIARFINHSCEPNCESEIEDGRVYIEARRDILPGEELTYDYHLTLDGRKDVDWLRFYACNCGAKKCRHTLLDSEHARRIARAHARKAKRRPRRPAPAPRGPRFPAQFAELLNERGLECLCDGPPGRGLRHRVAVPSLTLPNVLSRSWTQDLPRLLGSRLLKLMYPTLGRGATGRSRSRADAAIRILSLRGKPTPAIRVSRDIGLYQMVRSQSFRYFGEALSGHRLNTTWDSYLIHGKNGAFSGFHDHRANGREAPNGYVDVFVMLDNGGIFAQFVRPGAPPPKPARRTLSGRWLIVGSFDLAPW